MPDLKIFKPAPMARTFATMTYVYFGLTLCMLVGIPFGPGTRLVGWALFALALVVWFWFKPVAFLVDGQELVLRWRLRARRIPLGELKSALQLNTRDLGWMIRIGVGGLWGAYGMFKTSKEGMIDGYFNTNENLVLLKLKSGRPLLLSPERPGEFIRALGK
jgi:hypothetical protein